MKNDFPNAIKLKVQKCFCVLLAIAMVTQFITPSAHAQGDVYTTVSAGDMFTAAIKSDGSLWTWGRNRYGDLGDGTTIDRFSPVKVMDNVASVSAGDEYTMAIKTDGSLWAWGSNYLGTLGDGTETERHTPVKIMDDVVSVSAGDYHTAAIKKDGSLWIWGDNKYGQIGDGTITDSEYINGTKVYKENNNRLKPVKIMDDVVSVSVRTYNTFAVKSDGSLWAWGTNHCGMLGDNFTPRTNPTPQKIMDGVISVSSSSEYVMIVKSDNSLWATGYNYFPVLGDGTTDDRHTPVKIMNDVVSVSTGNLHTLALKTDGSLWAWGSNFDGQLGDGKSGGKELKYDDGIDQCTPEKIMNNVLAVSAGFSYTAIISSDGNLLTWGWNGGGQLGNGAGGNLRDFNATPTKIMKGIKLPDAAPKPVIAAQSATAIPTFASVLVDGKKVAFDAYNINDNNFFKLRDLAMVLNGTDKQFEISWDGTKNMITLTSGLPYTTVGGELTKPSNRSSVKVSLTTSSMYLDSSVIYLTAYNIGGNNYFKLRDVANAIDFGLTWDGNTSTIAIDTSNSYTA